MPFAKKQCQCSWVRPLRYDVAVPVRRQVFHGFESSRFCRARRRLYRGRRGRRISRDQAECNQHGCPRRGSGFGGAEPEACAGNRSLSQPGCNAGFRSERRCGRARPNPGSGIDERSSQQAGRARLAGPTDRNAEAGGRLTADRTTNAGSVLAKRVDFTNAFISSISSRHPGTTRHSPRRPHARRPACPGTACQDLR